MSVKTMTRVALLSATLYASKAALEFLPNVELVTLLIILYTLIWGKEALFAIMVFNLFELIQWGFGLWWISYLYVWPILCLSVLLLRKIIKEEFIVWGIFAGVFGMLFGGFFAMAYIPVDPAYAVAYWITGLPWDVWHGAWNFILMIALGKPVFTILRKIEGMEK